MLEIHHSAADTKRQEDFSRLLRPLIEPAFRLALAMLHDPHAAEDAVQEALLTAWGKLPSLQDREHVRPWFMKVVVNMCRNARRRKWSSGVTIGVPETLSVASAEEHVVRGADLRRAISRLREEDQLLIHLFFYLDMRLEEVAATVGGSVSATRARLYRSIKKIRPDLDPEEALK